MEVVNSRPFNNITGLENDGCYLSQRNVQNKKKSDYLLTNFYGNGSSDCGIGRPLEVATSQPGINFKMHVVEGHYGCNDDHYKKLRIDTLDMTPRTKLMLNKRPYLTIPYMGKGVFNPDLHSKMRVGDPINRNVASSQRDLTSIGRHSLDDYPFLPLVRDTVSNPENYIVENEGWVRGGIPSRDFYRDNSYKSLADS